MSWEKCKLSECTEYITDGDHQPAPKSEQGVHFIKIKDIVDNQVVFDAELYVPQEYYEKLPQDHKARRGDVLYTVVGSYGIPSYVNLDAPFCFERNIALLHPNSLVEPLFLYYALKNPHFFQKVEAVANGSAQKLIPLNKLKAMEIEIPPIDVQRRIADILSAYDDLIENNQKQIKLLEEAAQRLYKEWFVDLRFPGYENVNVVDGVPEGWKESTLGEVILFDPKVALDKEREKQFIPMTALSTTSMTIDLALITMTTSNSGSKFQNGDTLLARITPCLENGKTAFVNCIENPEGAVGSTEYIVMRSKKLNPYMVYCIARSEEFRSEAINSMTGSDGRQRAQKDKIKALNYLYPSQNVIDAFEKITHPMFEQIACLQKQIQNLIGARDLLLPKLMNGEIEV